MAPPATTARMTYGEYLAAEEASEVRHEFLNGEVWAMVYRRTDAGQWLLSEARDGETIEIAPLGVTLDVNVIYANPLEA